jgi:hypothetical protein
MAQRIQGSGGSAAFQNFTDDPVTTRARGWGGGLAWKMHHQVPPPGNNTRMLGFGGGKPWKLHTSIII